MGLKENIAGGFVSKLDNLIEKLGVDDALKKVIAEHIENNAQTAVQDVLDTYLTMNHLPQTESVFVVDESFDSDGQLEQGAWYVTFVEGELYRPRILTKAGDLLVQKLGAEPEHLLWTVFG